MKVFVHLGYGLDARSYGSRFLQGSEPDSSPYGFHLAREFGCSVEFSRDHTGWAYKAARRGVNKLLGFDLLHALRNRQEMKSSEAIWTMLETEWLAVATLFKLRLVKRRPLIANSVWLFQKWARYGRVRRSWLSWLAREATYLSVHSKEYLPYLRDLAGSTPCGLMYFGINPSTLRNSSTSLPKKRDTILVVAAGNDETRDWKTLLAAFGNDARFELVILCAWLRIDEASYWNVTVPRSEERMRYRDYYRAADVIAIPMHPNMYSGITVALEAAALGKPCVSTRTGGVPTYFAEDEVAYVQPYDPKALAETVNRIGTAGSSMPERAAQRFANSDYSTHGLIGRYVGLTKGQ